MDTAASWGWVWSRNALPSGVMHYPVGDGARSGCTAARYGQVKHFPVLVHIDESAHIVAAQTGTIRVV